MRPINPDGPTEEPIHAKDLPLASPEAIRWRVPCPYRDCAGLIESPSRTDGLQWDRAALERDFVTIRRCHACHRRALVNRP